LPLTFLSCLVAIAHTGGLTGIARTGICNAS